MEARSLRMAILGAVAWSVTSEAGAQARLC